MWVGPGANRRLSLKSPLIPPHMGDVTVLLERWNTGDAEALKELLAVVHAELRRLAGSLLRQERSDHTLQPTELVHEAYLRLDGLQRDAFEGRRHFYGAAAEVMRRILVDHARTAMPEARRTDRTSVPLELALNTPIDLRMDFDRLDEAVTALAAVAPTKPAWSSFATSAVSRSRRPRT